MRELETFDDQSCHATVQKFETVRDNKVRELHGGSGDIITGGR